MPDKKPVSFATHIVAGGVAGACEAVRPFSADDLSVLAEPYLLVGMSAS
jgi:hypothetical protein